MERERGWQEKRVRERKRRRENENEKLWEWWFRAKKWRRDRESRAQVRIHGHPKGKNWRIGLISWLYLEKEAAKATRRDIEWWW